MSQLFQLSHNTVRYTWDAYAETERLYIETDVNRGMFTKLHSHFAYKQSIMPPISSSLFCKLKFMKFVSMSTRYGGTSASLCCRNNDEATCVLFQSTKMRAMRQSDPNGRLTLDVQLSPWPLLPSSVALLGSPSYLSVNS